MVSLAIFFGLQLLEFRNHDPREGIGDAAQVEVTVVQLDDYDHVDGEGGADDVHHDPEPGHVGGVTPGERWWREGLSDCAQVVSGELQRLEVVRCEADGCGR